jgi:hypothetical protein
MLDVKLNAQRTRLRIPTCNSRQHVRGSGELQSVICKGFLFVYKCKLLQSFLQVPLGEILLNSAPKVFIDSFMTRELNYRFIT